jgi:hypothetical protein
MTVKWAESPSGAKAWVQVSWVEIGPDDGQWHVSVSNLPGAVVYDEPEDALRTAEFFAQRQGIDRGMWSAPPALREAMGQLILSAPRQPKLVDAA